MRVFLAGASGAIGRPLIARLIEGGHEVVAVTRSTDRGEALRALGAEPIVADVFDADAVHTAVAGARADAIVNQLTSLPPRQDPKAMRAALAATNRVRREGTANLVAAARGAGVGRMISQSVAFYYEPGGGPATEDVALWTGAPGAFGSVSEALGALESATTETEGIEGMVMRYGFFYGPGTWYAPGESAADDVRRRRFPIIGRGTSVWSWIHVDDAAAATVAALERWSPGIYNVCDDDPAPQREWLPVFAQAMGAPKPMRVPKLVAGLAAGRSTIAWLASLRGADNARAKAAWGLAVRSWREGFAQMRAAD